MRNPIYRGLAYKGYTLLMLATLGGTAWAYPSNIRPIAVNGSGLQNALNTIFGGCASGPCVNASANQSTVDMWQTSTVQNPTVTAVLQLSDVPSGDVFGIWSNPSQLVPIMYGSATPTDSFGFSTAATLQWNSAGALRITSPGGDCGSIDCSIVNGISSSSFGFYLQTPTGTYYTVDALNPDGAAQALTYSYDNEWVLAFDGTPVTGSSPGSYTDFVVGVQSISGLPEPGSIYLLGTIVPVIFFLRRRQLSQRRKV